MGPGCYKGGFGEISLEEFETSIRSLITSCWAPITGKEQEPQNKASRAMISVISASLEDTHGPFAEMRIDIPG